MFNISHILGLDENYLFYGRIQMALIQARMLMTLSLPVKRMNSQAEMGRRLKSRTQMGHREGRQVGLEDRADETLKGG